MGWLRRELVRLVLASEALVAAFSPAAWGGTSGGNPASYENTVFDFYVAAPRDWPCAGCPPAARRADPNGEQWRLDAPQSKNQLVAQFFGDYDAQDIDALGQRLGPTFKRRDRGALHGYANVDDPDHALDAVEYYLTAPRKVVRIESHLDNTDQTRAYELTRVRRSMHRASQPPQITELKMEGARATYKPGDRACYLVGVDDLRSDSTVSSLQTFTIAGQLSHWQFKSVTWNADAEAFRICVDVTTAFDADGLAITDLEVEDADGRRVSCQRNTAVTPPALHCRGWIGVSMRYEIKMPLPAITVDNPAPDHDGPQVRAVTCDGGRLSVDASDPSGVMIGEVFQNELAQVLYPDELGAGHSASLATIATRGLNTVSLIVVYDRNGNPTVLREHPLPTVKRSSQDNPELYYEIVPRSGAPTQTDIPVCTFVSP